LTSGMQETLRAVMRIEWSVDLDIAVPSAAKELGAEVKAVKGWLGSSELFGSAQMLTEGSQPIVTASDMGPQVVGAVEESESVGGAVGVDTSVVSLFAPLPTRTVLISLVASGECTEAVEGAIAAATGPLGGHETAVAPFLRGRGGHS
jgi:hypothetical protein